MFVEIKMEFLFDFTRISRQLIYMPRLLTEHDLGLDHIHENRNRSLSSFMIMAFISLASLGLAACSDKGSEGELDNAEARPPHIEATCEELRGMTKDCETVESYWTEERRRKAKPLPLPTTELRPVRGQAIFYFYQTDTRFSFQHAVSTAGSFW